MSEHGGNIHKARREADKMGSDFIDFSASTNPYGPPAAVYSQIQSQVRDLLHYPDPDYVELKSIIAKKYDVNIETIVLGNGSSDILFALFHVLKPKRAVIPVPSYIDYKKSAEISNTPVLYYNLKETDNFTLDAQDLSNCMQQGDLLLICSPNNPTGNLVSLVDIELLAGTCRECTIVIDEAYLDFIPGAASVASKYHNVYTINSLTKFHAIPGLRLGFGVFPKDVAQQLQAFIAPWPVNCFADLAGRACLADTDFDKTALKLQEEKQWMLHQLEKITQFTIYPGQANFLLIKLNNCKSCEDIQRYLLKQHLLIRNCSNFIGLGPEYMRVAVKSRDENMCLLRAFYEYYGVAPRKMKKKRCSRLMFQGTSSNAGKSILTAALCRILLQDGVKVAPFKAQNMSLNSYVTSAGGEMGRAQVVQAQAAKTDPDVRMNPVLLKPNSNVGSQIIVNGKVVGNMDIFQYNRFKPTVWESVTQSFRSLEDEYDAVILEGAGSPGEINLKHDDIVNMKMAEFAQSPVMLVGDIDRGGVYAAFIGTYSVLESWEKKLLAGFVVNKFRGEQRLLQSAHDYIAAKTGKDVYGVVPYLNNLGIPEEDSVTFKLNSANSIEPHEPYIDLAVIDLPHISNFTDIEPFYGEPDVRVRIIKRAAEFGSPDAVLIPGSKNVAADLISLKQSGLAAALIDSLDRVHELVGICGGYMMLGNTIEDPYRIESSTTSLEGLGLLECNSVLAESKCLQRKEGVHTATGLKVHGYEIHHGIIQNTQTPLFKYNDGSCCGVASEDGKVWGCYLHGVFDDDLFRRSFIDRIRQKKGLAAKNCVVAPYDVEVAFDRLASIVRQSLDMDKVYSLLGF